MAVVVDNKKLLVLCEKYINEFHTTKIDIKPHNPDLVKSAAVFIRKPFVAALAKHSLASLPRRKAKDNAQPLSCLKKPVQNAEKLGNGAFGNVYKIDAKTAVKVVEINTVHLVDFASRSQEIVCSKKAGELGIGPKIHDFYLCTTPDSMSNFGIIYMEYIKGKTLFEWLDTKPSFEERTQVSKLISQKVDLLHKHGIVHKDLHAGNIMVVSKNKKVSDVFIIDYGLAEVINKKAILSVDNTWWLMKQIFEGNEEPSGDITTYVISRMFDNGDIVFT